MVCYCFHIGQYHLSDELNLRLHVLTLRPILISFFHLHLVSHLSIHLIHCVPIYFTVHNCSHAVYNVRNIISNRVCCYLLSQYLLYYMYFYFAEFFCHVFTSSKYYVYAVLKTIFHRQFSFTFIVYIHIKFWI